MRTNLWNGKDFYAVNIAESFFYKSLVEKNRTIYDDYRELVNTTHPRRIKNKKTRVVSYENFYSIYEDIRDNGYIASSSIKFGLGRKNQGDLIANGQHRASILLYLDFDIEIRVRGRRAVPVVDKDSTVKLKGDLDER